MSTDDRRIAAERRLPESVAQDGHTRPAFPLFLFGECSAEERRRAEDVEQVAAHTERFQRLRLAESREEHIARAAAVRGELLVGADAGKALVPGAPIGVVGGGGDVARPASERVGLEDAHQFVRRLIRQGSQQHGPRHAEHRGAGPDADRERGDRDERVRGALAQRADAVAEILQRGFDKRHAAALVLLFFDLHRPSESKDRLPPRVAGREAAADVLVGQQIQV
jgi:hypothetical protein